jgi:predicted permease
MFVPLTFTPDQLQANRLTNEYLSVFGRLRSGLTVQQAQAEIDGLADNVLKQHAPQMNRQQWNLLLQPLNELVVGDVRFALWALLGAVGLVLLIACANVANLLLARAMTRSAEISVRLAVGAGRGRLMRQLLTESVLLAALGGALGVLVALWGNSALIALTDKDTGLLPNNVELSVNWRVLAFTLLVSLLTGVLFGLAPAWRATKLDLATSLKQSRRTTGAVSRLSKGLIVAQVALSLLLLVGAGLFMRTLHNLQRVSLGFNQENLLVFKLRPVHAGYKDERLMQFYQQLFAWLDVLPGVRAATFGRVALIARDNWFNGILLPGEDEMTAPRRSTMRQMVRENYRDQEKEFPQER